MPQLIISPIPTNAADSIWSGGRDAHNMQPEKHTSNGDDIICRHCLDNVAEGEPYLTLAHCPFPELQPYAEIGPIFLHAKRCVAYSSSTTIPDLYKQGKPRILRGYDDQNRIIYGTGKVVQAIAMESYALKLLDNQSINYVHVRSSLNNCYSFRIDRST